MGSDELAPLKSEQSKYISWAGHVSQLVAFLVAVVYVPGFLIVTFHHSQFNITEFGILRPRVFVAGTTFLVLAGLPTVMALRLEAWASNLGLRSLGEAALLRVICVSSFYHGCVLLVIGLSFLLGDLEPPRSIGGLLFLLWWPLAAGATSVVVGKFSVAPKSCALLWALVGLGLGVVVFNFFGTTFFLRSIWFLVTGVISVYLSWVLGSPTWRSNMEWEKLVLPATFGLLFYAAAIYGDISYSWGGGKPTSVTIYFSGAPLVSNSGGLTRCYWKKRSWVITSLGLKTSRQPSFYVVTKLSDSNTKKASGGLGWVGGQSIA